LNSSIYLENDFNSDNNKIQFSAKKFKSDFKDKAKITLYNYKKEKISYNSAEKNDISEENSAFEYKNEIKSETDINDEMKINPVILNFSKISLDSYIIRALRKAYWKLDEIQMEDFD
jgi:hypothetical protein